MKSISAIWIMVLSAIVAADVGAAEQTEPMTFAQCVDHALAHNPRIAAAQARVAAMDSRIGQAASGARPQLDLRTGYMDSTPAPGDLRNYSATLSARQLLYDSGETSARIVLARSQRDATVADLRGLALDVANEAARAYIEVLRAQRLVEVTIEMRDQAREHHALVKARYEVGAVARADVLRAEVEVAREHLETISAEKAEELARMRLLNSLGISQGERLALAGIDVVLPSSLERTAAMDIALVRRSELTAIAAQTDAAQAEVRAVRASSRPEVALQGDWGVRDNNFPPTDEAWTVGLTASMSLLDGGRTRERVAEARAEVRVLNAEREQQVQLIELAVAAALLNEEEARQRIDLAEEEVALARHSMEVAGGRYRVGEATLIELIDARTALNRALAGQAEGLYDYHAARADVARAMGLLPTEELSQR